MKKQMLVLPFLFLSTLSSISQNYKKVDSIVLTYPEKFNSVSKITKRISSDFHNDFDKIRAVYYWIANNVIYDSKEYGKYNFEYSTKTEFDKKENKYEKKLSSRVISKGKAVCEGYSTLFKAICLNLNIKSKIVTGSSKTLVKDIGKRYYSDHAWNMVEIDNKKYLIDVTWAATETYENRIKKKVNDFYFLTDPKLFIKNHYPDYYENSLLEDKVEKQDFLIGPIIYNHEYRLISPINGIIKKELTKKIEFKFATDNRINSISYTIGSKNYQVKEFKNNSNVEFEIDLSNITRARELIIYFDFEPIIGFKLK